MSNILSEEREEVVYRVKRKVTGVKCDKCGQVIRKNKYFEVLTGHNDWGNDSCDSVERHDICPDCINKFVADYLEETMKSDTAYIDIESKYIGDNRYVYE